MTCVLRQLLQPLKVKGFNPTFFGCDKDRSEIAAIRLVWPDASIQLCYWHAKRAIRSKLRDNKKTKSQNQYYPDEAKVLVPTLEICWGSYSVRRTGDHRYGRCQCSSAGNQIAEFGSIETTSIIEREIVIGMFSRHYNMHPSIPDKNGTYLSATQIHCNCINELYTWCYSRGYYRLWAYLYVNWYATEQWKLWARSANADEIPILKTTMIVESHWRRIKHDYLHRFNRPRIDLVVWVLARNVIPQSIERMKAILSKNHRLGAAAWRKDFKRQWKTLKACKVDPQSLLNYHTNPCKWTCGCDAFLLSRFLICKHIICCYEDVSDRFNFFFNIKRQRCSPFWVEQNLILLPQFRTQNHEILVVDEENLVSDDCDSMSGSDEGELVDLEDEVCEELAVIDDDVTIY